MSALGADGADIPVEEPVKSDGNFGWLVRASNRMRATQPANAHNCFARECITRV